jgi:lipopolysaccharide export system protein LptC
MRDTAGIPYVGGGSDRERVFRAATRHSRMVRFFRRAIPVSLIVILLSIAAAAYFQPLRMIYKLPLDAGRLVVSGTKITMEAPHLGGFTRDGRPYDLTARAAAQDVANPGVLELKDVRAHIEMQDKNTVEVVAATGVYDTKGDTMVLKTDIVVTSSAGYSVRMNEAQIDVRTNRMVSDKSVEVTLSNGTIKSKRMEVSENGDLMRFTGDVDVYLEPQAASAAPSEATPSAASAASTAGPKTKQ